MPPSAKPHSCFLCPLESKGSGFALPVGPLSAPVAIYGEALGSWEAWDSEAFVGPAGATLNRAIKLAGADRNQFRIHNIVSCRPPRDWLADAPWEKGATEHCVRTQVKPALAEWLAAGGKVIFAAGGVPTWALLGIDKAKGDARRVQDYHGSVLRDPTDRFWVVPSYHPAYVRDKEPGLLGVLVHDLQLALGVAQEGWVPDTPRLVVDPPPGWFAEWCEVYLAHRHEVILAVDTETAEKKGHDEDELMGERAGHIIRYNVACSTGEGVTVTNTHEYKPWIRRIMEADGSKVFWYLKFDQEAIEQDGVTLGGVLHDAMLMAHTLQSDIPMGLGFWAPFYSRGGVPWKHLVTSDFGAYSAGDAVQTLRCTYGLIEDLTECGMWHVYERHMRLVDLLALRPAERVGVGFDITRAKALQAKLSGEERKLDEEVRRLAPDAQGKLHPAKGWVRRPTKPVEVKVKRGRRMETHHFTPEQVEEIEVKEEVLVCTGCGEIDVQRRHKCGEREAPDAEAQDVASSK